MMLLDGAGTAGCSAEAGPEPAQRSGDACSGVCMPEAHAGRGMALQPTSCSGGHTWHSSTGEGAAHLGQGGRGCFRMGQAPEELHRGEVLLIFLGGFRELRGGVLVGEAERGTALLLQHLRLNVRVRACVG
eukprot:1153481-Pelagomonas_calceolata.AAC.2